MSIVIMDSTLKYLRFNYLWPPKGRELNSGRSFYIKFIAMLIPSTFLLIGSALHLIKSLQRKSNYNTSEDLVMILAEIGAYYFVSVFIFFQKEIAKIYLDLSDFTKYDKASHFDLKNKRLDFLFRSYKSFINVAIGIFCIIPLVNVKSCNEKNEGREVKQICGLLVAAWMPFNTDSLFRKIFLYFLQCYAIVMTLKGASVISFAIMETMEHLITRIQHLKMMLKVAINTQDRHQRRQLFSKCVSYHISIFDVGQRIDKYYTMCLFLHVLLSGALFGCIGYRIIETASFEESMNSACLFCGWFLSLFIVCISGQHLINEATSVADVVYESEWYNTEATFQKDIAFVILRAQRPIVVHAGPFSYLSHLIILAILKTAYSYLTLLNATSSNKN